MISVSTANEVKKVDEGVFTKEVSEEITVLEELNKATNFLEKRFLMMDIIRHEDSEMILAIDYILFKPLELENSIRNSFEFISKSDKDNLMKLIDTINNFLNQNQIQNSDLYTVINSEDLEKLKRISKQNLINFPKYLNKNLFLPDKNDLDLAEGELNEKAKIFTIEYLNDTQKLNKIKQI